MNILEFTGTKFVCTGRTWTIISAADFCYIYIYIQIMDDKLLSIQLQNSDFTGYNALFILFLALYSFWIV